ncbi:TPA: hypothetical protein QD004_002370 [Shewanella algae]|uniref:hypothetical protein n=1 Tax=Shewanella algae TaxID=38313 RepID=UPI001C57AC1C|nr:hypothetical protein [Shewanella algae]HDS1203077.1 hypothetical protein [Shewanella algae]
MFSYIFKGKAYTSFTEKHMKYLGMDSEQIESVIRQRDFELSQNHEKRKKAYREESDPLFLEWQYDDTQEAEKIWRDKVAEIKARYPL